MINGNNLFTIFKLTEAYSLELIEDYTISGYSTGATLQLAAVVFAGCMSLTAVTAAPWATDQMRIISLVSFLALEISIGIYFPSIGCLRSHLIPEERRATVTNWFRVPMNIITCVTLLAINHPAVAADKRPIFATCTGLLITGVVIASKFNTFISQQKKTK